jgi:hypothetical protein
VNRGGAAAVAGAVEAGGLRFQAGEKDREGGGRGLGGVPRGFLVLGEGLLGEELAGALWGRVDRWVRGGGWEGVRRGGRRRREGGGPGIPDLNSSRSNLPIRRLTFRDTVLLPKSKAESVKGSVHRGLFREEKALPRWSQTGAAPRYIANRRRLYDDFI